AKRGARVVLAARSQDVLARVADELGPNATYVVADVGRREDVQAIADKAIATFGGFDTWVNVAGLTVYGPLREIAYKDHERLIQTNLWGTVNGSLMAVEHLRKRGGALINVGSIASDLAFPFQGLYATSKHAVKGFTDTLRMELIADRAPVSVTLVKPASIDTPLPQRARNYMDREPTLPPPIYPPEEVANAILHAAVHPQRDIFVGGGGKMFVMGKEFAPGAYDELAPAIIALQKRAEEPRDPQGALHAPRHAGEVRGDPP
ncbi:SDR family oxidoreductase, partial [Methylobacterium hispanicum]